ncbi:MAG TPA: hypothetical protein VK137_06760, partial [Planctomycetaceae bacterium]|nr:hypothetical protein [Planctomycetaceae bacterium]
RESSQEKEALGHVSLRLMNARPRGYPRIVVGFPVQKGAVSTLEAPSMPSDVIAAMFWTGVNAAGYFLKEIGKRKAT